MKHAVVGGGPIGLFLGSKLKETTLFDQKKSIGVPTRCTGILTKDIEQFLTKKELKEISENKITSTVIKGPKSTLKLKIGTNYIISNQRFEELLAKKATNKGCEIHTSHRYLKSDQQGHHIKNVKTGKVKTIQSPHLVGCDGPMSAVAKFHGLNKHQVNYMGHQVTIKVKNHKNSILFYPHIGRYAWYVPESETTARVGVCTNMKGGKAVFDAFLKKFPGKVLSNQSGIIPTFQPRRKNRLELPHYSVTLLGDAAGHIKNTTGGGILPGMKAAETFARNSATIKEDRALRRELYTHFLVHNLVSDCSHAEWDKIIAATAKHKDVLEHINRDNLLHMARKVLFDKTYLSIGLKKVLGGKVALR